ncbi:MAG: hypothetical protein QF441_03055 [Bacteriovoracaceae bacterium]|jgi:hypothetical protein|nr:hypothetical protein [Bacteriovoracaceae bacterium]
MRCCISDSDKTDEIDNEDWESEQETESGVHIEEYDQTATSGVQTSTDITKENIKNKVKSAFSKLKKPIKKKQDATTSDEDVTGTNIDFDSDEPAQGTATRAINQKLPFLGKILNKVKKQESSDEEIDFNLENDGETSKRKLQLKPIHLIIIAALGVLLFLDFEEEPKSPAPKSKPIKKVQKKEQPKNEQKSTTVVEEKKVQKTESEALDSMSPPIEEITQQESESQKNTVEENDVKDQGQAQADLEPTESEETEQPTKNSDLSQVEDISKVVEQAKQNLKTKKMDWVEEPIFDSPSEEDSSVDTETEAEVVEADVQFDETVSDEQVAVEDETTQMTKQLLTDLESKLQENKEEQALIEVVQPASAPHYETVGKSLVYNCEGKHWACVEMSEFIQCRKNFSWNKKSSIPVECYPYLKLDNPMDCVILQQEKIDSVAKTDFCMEK